MANNTVRTIAIFGIITLVLGGAAIGVVRLMKARNNSYATSQSQPTATNNKPEQQQTPPPAEQKKEETKQEEQKPQDNKPATTETPAPSTPTPTPTPSTQQQPTGGSPSSVAATGATPNGSMPATGPTEDFLATAGLLSLAVFFGAKLIRARADYRRYVGS